MKLDRTTLGPYEIRAARHLVGRRMQHRVIPTPQWANMLGFSPRAAARWERPIGSSHHRTPSDLALTRIYSILEEHGLTPADCINEAKRHADARQARGEDYERHSNPRG